MTNSGLSLAYIIGLGYAVVVSVLWASYTPLVKLVYSIPGHPEPVTFTAVKQTVAAVIAVLIALPYACWSEKTVQATNRSLRRNRFSNLFQSVDIRARIFLEIGFWSGIGTVA